MIRRSSLLLLVALAVLSCRQQKSTHAEWKGGKIVPPGVSSTAAGTSPTDMKNKAVTAVIKPLPAGFFDRSAIGSVLAKDGTVLAQQTSFVQGDPVFVTMRFVESPAGLQASLRLLDEKGTELHREAKEMNGQKIVTFQIPPALIKKPGSYSVTGYWGGNDACEYKIDVRSKPHR